MVCVQNFQAPRSGAGAQGGWETAQLVAAVVKVVVVVVTPMGHAKFFD
jgi:hypothetical protein